MTTCYHTCVRSRCGGSEASTWRRIGWWSQGGLAGGVKGDWLVVFSCSGMNGSGASCGMVMPLDPELLRAVPDPNDVVVLDINCVKPKYERLLSMFCQLLYIEHALLEICLVNSNYCF